MRRLKIDYLGFLLLFPLVQFVITVSLVDDDQLLRVNQGRINLREWEYWKRLVDGDGLCGGERPAALGIILPRRRLGGCRVLGLMLDQV